MGALAVLVKSDPNGLGEALRSATFVGEGFGCYENFNVRRDAREWTVSEKATFVKERFGDHPSGIVDFIISVSRGYTFSDRDLTVDAFWYWDGDGTLYFRVRQGGKHIREIVSNDCKKDGEWRNFDEWLKEKNEEEAMWHGSAW